MKMKRAWDIIEGRTYPGITSQGFMVSFDWKRDIFLHSDHFPDKHAGEKLIETEEEAWELAYGFANKTLGQAVNICVVDRTFSPVPGYEEKIINSTRRKKMDKLQPGTQVTYFIDWIRAVDQPPKEVDANNDGHVLFCNKDRSVLIRHWSDFNVLDRDETGWHWFPFNGLALPTELSDKESEGISESIAKRLSLLEEKQWKQHKRILKLEIQMENQENG